jgi:hypothetical protein
MRKIVAIFFLVLGGHSFAQQDIKPTDQFTVQGLVKNQLSISLSALASYGTWSTDSVVIMNHLMQKKYTLRNLKGILFKDILEKAEIQASTPKELSKYYIICVASDNYKVVFSWNEIFNSKTGEKVYILTEVDGKPVAATSDRITLISTNDLATGRQFVKGLEKIIVERVK